MLAIPPGHRAGLALPAVAQPPPNSPHATPVPPSHRMAAARLLLGGRQGEAVWFLRRLEEEGWRPDDLWCIRDTRDRLLAAGLISMHPGRTATLAVSPCTDSTTLEQGAALLEAMVHELGRRGSVTLAQGLSDADEPSAGEPFQRAGFRLLAVLDCMERPNRRISPMPDLPAGVEIRPADDDALLKRVLRASYEQTLDCPGLAELRTDQDILDGHRRGRQPDADLWMVLHVDGQPAGATLLNHASGSEAVELTYLGLARWARGRGLGSLLLDTALSRAARLPEPVITLAVDERNTPARRLYAARGFRTRSRRGAFARVVHSST
jgi:mycothiol synthase